MNLPTLAGPQATLLGAYPTLLGQAMLSPAPNLYGLGEDVMNTAPPVANDQATGAGSKVATTLWALARLAAAGADTYHGYRRNQSVGWGIWWGLMGATFPVVTTGIALAQGFGKEK